MFARMLGGNVTGPMWVQSLGWRREALVALCHGPFGVTARESTGGAQWLCGGRRLMTILHYGNVENTVLVDRLNSCVRRILIIISEHAREKSPLGSTPAAGLFIVRASTALFAMGRVST